MPDEKLQLIFDELEKEAVRRCRETPEGKEASSEYCRLWDALLAVIPKEFRDILFAFESAVGWKGAVERNYIQEAAYLYGLRKGIQIAGGVSDE